MTGNGILDIRRTASRYPCLRWVAYTLTVLIWLLSAPSVGRADSGNGVWTDYLTRASGCEDAINDDVSEGTRCLVGNGLVLMLNRGMGLADAYGKRKFGQHFKVVGDLNYSPVSNKIGIEGDIDVVLPFTGAAWAAGRPGVSSFFFQQGVTRSWDDSGSGLFRNDLRQGMVRRFRVSGAADADVLGVSAFHMLSAERGHRVLVPGIDYAGRWGIGTFRYFIPTTGWRPGSSGYEERAIEGLELGMRFDLTTTLRLNTVGYRWMAEDGSDRWNTGGRVDLDWRPHPWLEFGAGYDGFGGGENTATFEVTLSFPLGEQSKSPPWQGLGTVSKASAPTADDLWRPIEDIGPIKLATRQTVSGLVETAEVRFLQDAIGTGGEVLLEVVLPAPAPEDIQVVVRLVPGDGPNPAVPGEDFVDEPVETTVQKGTTSSSLSIPLLRNESLQAPRSLDATVTIAS